jgi:hypothetical protein
MPITDVSMVSEDALSLKVFLDKVLEKTIKVFEENNVPLPSRRFWTVGEPAIDCEQLVVSFMQMYLGTPGDQAGTPRCLTDLKTKVRKVCF